MTEFPVDTIWIIKTMTLRSIWNPNALYHIINNLLYVYFILFLILLTCIIIIFAIKLLYKLFKKTKENNIKKEKTPIKKDLKDIFSKEKNIFKLLKYPTIWTILISTAWIQVSIRFWLFWLYYKNIASSITKEDRPIQEWRILWFWASWTLLLFIMAWFFFGLSFWNKLVRNIWILFYILWIFFMMFLLFLDYWYVSDWLENLVI